jgi:hypothetical protein
VGDLTSFVFAYCSTSNAGTQTATGVNPYPAAAAHQNDAQSISEGAHGRTHYDLFAALATNSWRAAIFSEHLSVDKS